MARDFAAHLAAAVRARRGALRLSQQDLADMAGVSERFVRFVEQGKPSLRLDTLLALLDTLGLELQLATRTSAAARALAARALAAQPLMTQPLVTQPPPAVPSSGAPLEGDGPSARENQP
ncbi:type II toxin-antitoxin system Y4mF family antitoxin [Arthrobacter globiformis]|uniref:type II toxin-antitoxin system Y4mF family antitoxin n=1 Tax=Arthrobacter globiformis TaxID=1665 RepID=UPI002785ECAE|nr:type II toxin-antitoxin system Y4mF family antitoxin [Arthrobacter globiformis]MDQ0862468.1 HTH-type transcriptional regulator/antitoxin HipB [Arthrobacter globiformis]